MSYFGEFLSPTHIQDLNSMMDIEPINYVVNGRIPLGDFEDEVKTLVKDYIISKWSISNPAKSTDPPNDYKNKIRFGDFDYDSFSTYYIKISEDATRFDNSLMGQGLLGFMTPVLFKLSARRLSHTENFPQLENMKKELIRIMGRYELYDIPGIAAMSIMEPSDEPQQLPGQRSIYEVSVTAMAYFIKNYY